LGTCCEKAKNVKKEGEEGESKAQQPAWTSEKKKTFLVLQMKRGKKIKEIASAEGGEASLNRHFQKVQEN